MRSFAKTVLTAAAIVGLYAGAASAKEAYEGTWGADAAQCKKNQEDRNAPLVVTSKGYDAHETHCKFSGTKKTSKGFATTVTCSVEGDKQVDKVTLVPKGDSLTLMWDGGDNWDLKRC